MISERLGISDILSAASGHHPEVSSKRGVWVLGIESVSGRVPTEGGGREGGDGGPTALGFASF